MTSRAEVRHPAGAVYSGYLVPYRVADLKKTKYGWSAVVRGVNEYEVDICMKGDIVENMDCTCPEAADGSYCRHMSAVLSAAAEADLFGEEGKEPVSVTDLLDELDEDTLRRELRSLLQNDPGTEASFCRKYSTLSGTGSRLHLIRRDLEEIREKYGDENGHIPAENARAYAGAFTDCLYDHVRPLIEQQKTMSAFRTLNEAFLILNRADLDEADGERRQIGDVIESMWVSVYYLCDEEEERKMHEWFSNMHLFRRDLLLYDSIESMYLMFFDS